ncbi:MAG: T9SS type A sorting domain-containing protein [Bacteroidetes bacterium]|nr:T9SS type A sorting domain-containing protein [Bacteroidota bacterium]
MQRESQTNHSNSNIVDTKNIEIKFSKAKISIFIQPNPTTGCVTVKLTNDENLDNKKLIVRNMIGENLKEIIFIGNETVFNLTNLPKGIYLIEMNSDQKQLISKLILN